MAANTNPIFIKEAINTVANTQIGNTIANADGTDKKTVITGANDGTLIYDIIASSTDAVERYLLVYIGDGVTDWTIGQITIPAEAKSVSLLNIALIPGLAKRDDGAIFLYSGQTIKVAATAAVTADKAITCVAIGGNL